MLMQEPGHVVVGPKLKKFQKKRKGLLYVICGTNWIGTSLHYLLCYVDSLQLDRQLNWTAQLSEYTLSREMVDDILIEIGSLNPLLFIPEFVFRDAIDQKYDHFCTNLFWAAVMQAVYKHLSERRPSVSISDPSTC